MSPSPYTANTDRARQFNVRSSLTPLCLSLHTSSPTPPPPPQAYVRGVIERKLDVLIPISHQPRELISEIIADASGRFPEFSSCVRKRIRTFLKSFRRSKKVKDHQPGLNGMGGSPHHSKVQVHGMALLGPSPFIFSLPLPPPSPPGSLSTPQPSPLPIKHG